MKLIINEYQNNFLVNKSVMLDIVNVDVYIILRILLVLILNQKVINLRIFLF